MKKRTLAAMLGTAVLFAAGGLYLIASNSNTANHTSDDASAPSNSHQRDTPTGKKAPQKQKPAPAAATRPNGRRSGGRPPTLVVTQSVGIAVINDRLKAIGSGMATASVSVVPLSSGMLSEIRVQPGQKIQQGDVIAKLDDQEQVISRDRALRTLQDAQTDEARLSQLFRTRTTTEVELNRARAALADAELALREAELQLSRRTITAPLSGVAGLLAMDTGNYVSTQTELLTLDDRSSIIVEFWVPERFATQLKLGQAVDAMALANPGKQHEGVISAIGSRIDVNSRTLPVRATISNSHDKLMPGMSFSINLLFSGDTYPAVNPLAIQWDSNGAYVWRIRENKAQRVDVKIIQRNPESILVAGELIEGDELVTEGLLALRPGATVRTAGQQP